MKLGIWYHDPQTGGFPLDVNGNIDLSQYAPPKPDVWTG
jgi:hypothetical protein